MKKKQLAARIATLERDLDDLLAYLRLQRNPYRPMASADFVAIDDAQAKQPAPSMAQRIEAALDKLTNSDDGLTYGEQSIRFEAAIRAAAAVPHTIEIGVRGFAPTDYYNAGQDSILAPILAALEGGDNG